MTDVETVREALNALAERVEREDVDGWSLYALGKDAFDRLTARLDAAERELQAARQMRDAFGAFDDAEGRGLTRQAIQAFRNKEQAIKGYDAIRPLPTPPEAEG